MEALVPMARYIYPVYFGTLFNYTWSDQDSIVYTALLMTIYTYVKRRIFTAKLEKYYFGRLCE